MKESIEKWSNSWSQGINSYFEDDKFIKLAMKEKNFSTLQIRTLNDAIKNYGEFDSIDWTKDGLTVLIWKTKK